MQRALLQYRSPQNHALVRKALRLCGREDLIGFGKGCLVPPGTPKASASTPGKKGGAGKAAAPQSRAQAKTKPKRSDKWAKAKPKRK